MMITTGFGWNAIALPAALLSFLAMTSLLILRPRPAEPHRRGRGGLIRFPRFAKGQHQAVSPRKKGRRLQ